jgi:hypothetical protein
MISPREQDPVDAFRAAFAPRDEQTEGPPFPSKSFPEIMAIQDPKLRKTEALAYLQAVIKRVRFVTQKAELRPALSQPKELDEALSLFRRTETLLDEEMEVLLAAPTTYEQESTENRLAS